MRYSPFWRPVPVVRPVPPPDVTTLPGIQRVAEVLRYAVLSLEYSLSPGGGLRAWLKLNLTVGLVLGIPALIVVPVVTVLLAGMVSWTALLLQIVLNLLYAALALMALVFVVLLIPQLFSRRR